MRQLISNFRECSVLFGAIILCLRELSSYCLLTSAPSQIVSYTRMVECRKITEIKVLVIVAVIPQFILLCASLGHADSNYLCVRD